MPVPSVVTALANRIAVPVPSVVMAPANSQGHSAAQSETSELSVFPQAAANWRHVPLRRQLAVFIDDIDRPVPSVVTAPANSQGHLAAQSETSELSVFPQAAANWWRVPFKRQLAVFIDDIDRPYAGRYKPEF